MEENNLNTNSSKLARNLYSKTSKLEKELANALRKTKDISDKSITNLRNTIQKNYEQIMFTDIAFSSSKDVDQLLWKAVFYRPIEEFRKLIKKYHAAASKNIPQAKEKLHSIMMKFKLFLEDAIQYYVDLYNRLDSYFGFSNEHAKNSLHKCLIILGDLERYKQLYGEKKQKDWSISTEYYLRAIKLVPSNGNPHNQLAVLATYQNDEYEAIYRYFRSLSVSKPFISARENLILLFEKNRKSLLNLKIEKEHRLNNFLLEFVRAHGILFTRTSLETFEKIKTNVCNNMAELIKTRKLDELRVLKMIIMNIFSIENALHNTNESPISNDVIVEHALDLANSVFVVLTSVTVLQQFYDYLSAIVIYLQYIKLHKDVVLKDTKNLKEIWVNIAELLNQLNNEEESDNDKALPEDIELIGFVPLGNTNKLDELLPEYEFVPKRIKLLRELTNDFCKDERIGLFVNNGIYSTDQTMQVQEPTIEGNNFQFEGIQDDFDHELSDFEDQDLDQLEETQLEGTIESPKESPKESPTFAPTKDNKLFFVGNNFGKVEEEENELEDEIILFKPEENKKDSRIIDRPFGNSSNVNEDVLQWNMQSKNNSFFGHSMFLPTPEPKTVQTNTWNSYSFNAQAPQSRLPKMTAGSLSDERIIERPFQGNSQHGNNEQAINHPFNWNPFQPRQQQYYDPMGTGFFSFPRNQGHKNIK